MADAGAFLVALAGALASAVGFVLQQEGAEQAPPEHAGLTLRLLADLVHRPVWMVGIGAMVAGSLLGALSLGIGGLTLVEPANASMILFALLIAAVFRQQRLGLGDKVGALALAGGVAVVVLAANPTDGDPVHVPWPRLLGAGLVVASLVACALRLRRVLPAATMLGVAAGLLFGVQDALTRRALQLLLSGPLAMLGDFSAYLLVGCYVLTLLLAQNAFRAGPLAASLPAMSVLEPVCGIALGAGLFEEQFRHGSAWLVAEVVALAAMVLGLLRLSRSQAVSGRR